MVKQMVSYTTYKVFWPWFCPRFVSFHLGAFRHLNVIKNHCISRKINFSLISILQTYFVHTFSSFSQSIMLSTFHIILHITNFSRVEYPSFPTIRVIFRWVLQVFDLFLQNVVEGRKTTKTRQKRQKGAILVGKN